VSVGAGVGERMRVRGSVGTEGWGFQFFQFFGFEQRERGGWAGLCWVGWDKGGGSKGVTLVGRQVDAWVGGYRIVLRSVRRKMLAWVRVHRGALAGLNRIQSLRDYTGSAESANVTSKRIRKIRRELGTGKEKKPQFRLRSTRRCAWLTFTRSLVPFQKEKKKAVYPPKSPKPNL
jgi:hypothetical protein